MRPRVWSLFDFIFDLSSMLPKVLLLFCLLQRDMLILMPFFQIFIYFNIQDIIDKYIINIYKIIIYHKDVENACILQGKILNNIFKHGFAYLQIL